MFWWIYFVILHLLALLLYLEVCHTYARARRLLDTRKCCCERKHKDLEASYTQMRQERHEHEQQIIEYRHNIQSLRRQIRHASPSKDTSLVKQQTRKWVHSLAGFTASF